MDVTEESFEILVREKVQNQTQFSLMSQGVTNAIYTRQMQEQYLGKNRKLYRPEKGC